MMSFQKADVVCYFQSLVKSVGQWMTAKLPHVQRVACFIVFITNVFA